jgi:hypothetical protein
MKKNFTTENTEHTEKRQKDQGGESKVRWYLDRLLPSP